MQHIQNLTNTEPSTHAAANHSRSQHVFCNSLLQGFPVCRPAHYCLLSTQKPKGFLEKCKLFHVIPVLKNSSCFLILLGIKSRFLEIEYMTNLIHHPPPLPVPTATASSAYSHHVPESTLCSVHMGSLMSLKLIRGVAF